MEEVLCELHSVCVSVYPSISFWMTEPIFMKIWYVYHDPWAISKAYFINTSYQSVYLYVYAPIVARQRLGKNVTVATNIQATIEELLDASPSMRSASCQGKYEISSSQNSLF
jgi:hypothetical protein